MHSVNVSLNNLASFGKVKPRLRHEFTFSSPKMTRCRTIIVGDKWLVVHCWDESKNLRLVTTRHRTIGGTLFQDLPLVLILGTALFTTRKQGCYLSTSNSISITCSRFADDLEPKQRVYKG